MKTYNEYIKAAHENAKEKGFYDDPMELEERFFLVITELAECGEAYRSRKWATEIKTPIGDHVLLLFRWVFDELWDNERYTG